MRICFDMDGTIANLYGIDNWLTKLKSGDASPYKEAQALLNMNSLARTLNILQRKGYEIGIISWLANNSTPDYDEKVTQAKHKWLTKHFHSVHFNFIQIVEYGTDKNICLTSTNDILFDDEQHNRDTWNGVAFDVTDILSVLRGLY